MRLEVECPRCPSSLTAAGAAASCPVHGEVTPLWRAVDPCYEAFAEHLGLSRGLPTWLPWPLPIGWQVTDFGCVGGEGVHAEAAFVTVGGATELDGPVEISVVTEEPGVGLGARCGQVAHADAGADPGATPPLTRIDVEGVTTPMWLVPASESGEALDRAVLAGEAQGRWLWLVLRPASVALSLSQLGPLVDVSGFGPQLVSLPFGSVPRGW